MGFLNIYKSFLSSEIEANCCFAPADLHNLKAQQNSSSLTELNMNQAFFKSSACYELHRLTINALKAIYEMFHPSVK